MSLEHYLSCDGPGCTAREKVHCYAESRRDIQVSLPAGWVQDPGWGHWCSGECHKRWTEARYQTKKRGRA